MFICRVADDTAAVIPAWMFDPSRCAGMALGAPSTSLTALEQMRVILRELGFDGPATATPARPQEGADEAEAMVAKTPSPEDAVVPAPAGATRDGARPRGTGRRRRRARPAAAGSRGRTARSGGRP